MESSQDSFDISLLESALKWFASDFGERVIRPLETHFVNHALTPELQEIIDVTEKALSGVELWRREPMSLAQFRQQFAENELVDSRFLKQVILLYRRNRAAETERLTEKTLHLELTSALERDRVLLDALANEDWFQKIEPLRLPRLKDYLPVQYIEGTTSNQHPFLARQFDEKFHILQAPSLFLPDLQYFRAKCEERETTLAVAFLDIDDFKQHNKAHKETKIDRNLLPRFMQTVEAHVFHHGFAYRQGGDEYLILVPSISARLAIGFFDELRDKLANLKYADISEQTTVSIGLCIVDPDCSLTDREIRERANEAKEFAKEKGKNCIATFTGNRFVREELKIAKPSV